MSAFTGQCLQQCLQASVYNKCLQVSVYSVFIKSVHRVHNCVDKGVYKGICDVYCLQFAIMPVYVYKMCLHVYKVFVLLQLPLILTTRHHEILLCVFILQWNMSLSIFSSIKSASRANSVIKSIKLTLVDSNCKRE